jgi:hypothetical protein
MGVYPVLIANGEASEFVEPGEAMLDDLLVTAKLLADAAPGDAGFDLAVLSGLTAAPMIVSLVGVQLVRSAPGSTLLAYHGRHGVDQVFEGHAVVDVGSGQDQGRRNAVPIRNQVPFGAGPASFGWVRAGRRSPLFAVNHELSTPARPQPIRSASRKRRQQITPEPHPISAGSISPEMPVRRMNTMPVRAARAVTSGRPPSGLAEIGGSDGSMINHKASGETELGIPSHASLRIRA